MSDLMMLAQAAQHLAHLLPMVDTPGAQPITTVASADVAANAHAIATIGKGLAYGVAAAGAGVGIGLVFASAIQGVARQPEQAGQLRQMMLLGFALIEALALIGFALVFIL
jgi:F-type H+-transporting ATPase subunit c